MDDVILDTVRANLDYLDTFVSWSLFAAIGVLAIALRQVDEISIGGLKVDSTRTFYCGAILYSLAFGAIWLVLAHLQDSLSPLGIAQLEVATGSSTTAVREEMVRQIQSHHWLLNPFGFYGSDGPMFRWIQFSMLPLVWWIVLAAIISIPSGADWAKNGIGLLLTVVPFLATGVMSFVAMEGVHQQMADLSETHKPTFEVWRNATRLAFLVGLVINGVVVANSVISFIRSRRDKRAVDANPKQEEARED